MGAFSCLAEDVACYSVAKVKIGKRATVSQYSFLCSASHDYRDRTMPLVAAPITIGDDAWVTAGVFVGPGVTIGNGAVAGARAVVIDDVDPWTVVAGNPARYVKDREPFS